MIKALTTMYLGALLLATPAIVQAAEGATALSGCSCQHCSHANCKCGKDCKCGQDCKCGHQRN